MGKIMINGEQYPSCVVKSDIDDSRISDKKAWSSAKVNNELEDIRNELVTVAEEVGAEISDSTTSTDAVWSSNKTKTYVDGQITTVNTTLNNKFRVGTAAASTSNCPTGCWYGRYE